ncbi:MAG TPA: amidohydrolase [Hyphomicrobiaceae bacterium]
MSGNQLLSEFAGVAAELVAIRHKIHRHPETAYEEVRTAELIAGLLRRWGLDVADGIGGTGVVGTLRGDRGAGPAIGLRADMDALHIDEVDGRGHRSTIAGKMHACGHDGHIAMLLGAARYLADRRDFRGSVHFIFQPAEEGMAGAKRMIEDGLFDRHPVDRLYGMHNMPGIPAGEFRTRSGAFLAASDTWRVAFRGTGGHGGAGAHAGTDATLAQAGFILALQTIVSRNVPAIETAVVSVGSVAGGNPDAPNVIPSEVAICGTARSHTAATRELISRRLTEIAGQQAAVFGCTAEVAYEQIYPPLVTDTRATAISVRAAAALVGGDRVHADAERMTISEDFAFMLERRPGGFILIGNGMDRGGAAQLHTSSYDFNDSIVTVGAAYWVQLVRDELGSC